MNREGYWDYMGRRLREERIKKEVISQEDMWKKEIAEMKMSDLNASDIEGAMKIIAGTARSMGVNVVED